MIKTNKQAQKQAFKDMGIDNNLENIDDIVNLSKDFEDICQYSEQESKEAALNVFLTEEKSVIDSL